MTSDDSAFPRQPQEAPGSTGQMRPQPQDSMAGYRGRGLLDGRKALITGGDSGIGRAVAVGFAKEGADVAIAYLDEHEDARRTSELVEAEGRRCVTIAGDLARLDQCERAVEQTVAELGGLDLLVNNVATQRPVSDLTEISDEEWASTFEVNIHSYFRVTKAALPHLPKGASVINTASVNGLRGNPSLVAYATTKGAVVAFTYSLAQALAEREIRVNAVAPGPVWTPLIPSTLEPEKVEKFGRRVPLGRAAQPDELAPSYIFLASNELSSYYTGEVLSALGGEIAAG
jgi:NAD(P)-dependent dehydrogenase (short-subunit alcohol dehydrogenase family)